MSASKDLSILEEAERLHHLGLAVHWLRPRSKAPVDTAWTTGPRKEWRVLKTQYRPGFNLGVRLGTPSHLKGKYLAALDIDVKSESAHHQREAETAVKKYFPKMSGEIASVSSGRGNGSRHLYFLTEKPIVPLKLESSPDKVKVFMPTAPLTVGQMKELTEKDTALGMRSRHAWEIALMGEGQQVVLPPSIHPDSKKAYAWSHRINSLSDLLALPLDQIPVLGQTKKITRDSLTEKEVDFAKAEIYELPKEIIKALNNGDIEDRSAALFDIAIQLVRHGLTDAQIANILTNPTTFLGQTAYDHTKTLSKKRAMDWVYNYTLKKVRAEYDANSQFDDVVEILPLTETAAEKQDEELKEEIDWRTRLERGGQKGDGKPKPTLKNTVLVLVNAVAPDVFKWDEFGYRHVHGVDTPWRTKKGSELIDVDVSNIRFWISQKFGFDPGDPIVDTAIEVIASENTFHPIREAWAKLPMWDGVERLDTALSTYIGCKGDKEYLAQVFRKWMVAAVKRIYEPGAKFDWMIIFESAQGKGKSSFGSILFGDRYFKDWLPRLEDKDAALGLRGIQCVEFGEMSDINRSEIETTKAFITRTVDKVRPPYGHREIDIPRQCVFFGTTNKEEYLKDDTGNRRFNPVQTGKLNFEALRRDREQLFAEAIFLYQNGLETWLYLEGHAEMVSIELQNEKLIKDDASVMAEMILDAIENPKTDSEMGSFNFEKFRISDLFSGDNLFHFKWKHSRFNEMLAAKAIKMLGGSKHKSHGKSVWGIPKREKGIEGAPSEIGF